MEETAKLSGLTMSEHIRQAAVTTPHFFMHENGNKKGTSQEIFIPMMLQYLNKILCFYFTLETFFLK